MKIKKLLLKRKNILIAFFALILVSSVAMFFVLKKVDSAGNSTATINVGNLSSIITASGDVEAQNQANLTFLTSGRIAYLGVKEGMQVKKGDILANLDTTIVAHNVTAAAAQYRSAQAALNKILDDIHLFQYGNGGFGNVGSANETQTQKTARQQAEEAVNVAYDNLASSQKQLELQSIIAPFDGKVLSVQNISEGTNVSPITGSSITVIGGEELKFVANVLEQDIDNIHEGQEVIIHLDAKKELNLTGTIERIAAGKTTLSDGRNIFKVDISSSDLRINAQVGQTGNIEININKTGIIIVPSWIVLANKYIWVSINGRTTLKEVKVGLTVGGKTSIISGLSPEDRLILNPEVIAKNNYKLL